MNRYKKVLFFIYLFILIVCRFIIALLITILSVFYQYYIIKHVRNHNIIRMQ